MHRDNKTLSFEGLKMSLYEKFTNLNVISVDPSLNCTGVYSNIAKNGSWSYKSKSVSRYAKLLNIYESFKRDIRSDFQNCNFYNILLVEDYAFSRQSRSVTVMAEVGGIIRVCATSCMIDIFEIPSSFWKKHSGFGKTMKKTTIKNVEDYLKHVNSITGCDYSNPDEADAHLIYISVSNAIKQYESGELKDVPKCLQNIIDYLKCC